MSRASRAYEQTVPVTKDHLFDKGENKEFAIRNSRD